MIARAGSGWQTVLADLSMILFMVTASAASEAPPSPPPPPPAATLPALGDPVALWQKGEGGPSLKDWLVSAAPDPRLRLTIMAPPEQSATALALAASAGRPARVLIEPGTGGVIAALTYDQALAQALQPQPAALQPQPAALQPQPAKENLP